MNHTTEPTRQEVDSLDGLTLLEFGASWCPHCQAAQPHIAAVLKAHPGLRHIRIEDGSGRPLGRSFRVKLWPTLVLMSDGVEKARVVRPRSVAGIDALFAS
jgi:thioredoxin 1